MRFIYAPDRPPGALKWRPQPFAPTAGAVPFPKRKARLWAGRFANIPNVMKREQNRHKRLFTLSPRELNLSDSHGVLRGPPAALSFARSIRCPF